jgi:hypothetical protein
MVQGVVDVGERKRTDHRLLLGAVGVEALALAAFIYLPWIADALGGRPLAPAQWALVAIGPWLLLGADEARRE